VVEPVVDCLPDGFFTEDLKPIQEEVIIVKHILALLAPDIFPEQLVQVVKLFRAPGKVLFDYVFKVFIAVDPL
jgi:hypothetical protein